MEQIFTLAEAEMPTNLPEREDPDLVKEIVFQTGLNDSRDIRTSVETIVKRQKKACHLLHHKYKNARFHIIATAPITLKQKNLNKQLEDYATSAGISFVSNDAILDEAGEIKVGMMNGIHYTPLGTTKVATQLKRSLYAKEPIQGLPHQQQPSSRGRQSSLLRPSYLSHQNQQPAWQNQRQHSGPRLNANQGDDRSLIEALSALVQKWQGPRPQQ